MRAGIVTIFDNENFGNRLQNYALSKILHNYLESTYTIKNKFLDEKIYKRMLRACALAENVILNRVCGKKRKGTILSFNNKYLDVGRSCYWFNVQKEKVRCIDSCDIYCAGSDQVWNPTLGRTAIFNYLGFAERDRTFSYAASFGVDTIPDEHRDAVKKGLEHIKFISVREDAGKRIVEELTGRTDVQVLVDPTMLLTTPEWDEVAEETKQKLPEKYVMTYFLGEVSENRRQAVENKAAELGCEVIWTMDKGSPFYDVGPGHFVHMIKYAQMVCTDSFHGSVFSFLYGRPLAIFDRNGGDDMSSRLVTLAKKFSLQCNLVKNDDLTNLSMKPDYSTGYLVLEEERKKSKAYLDMVFEEAERAGLCK